MPFEPAEMRSDGTPLPGEPLLASAGPQREAGHELIRFGGWNFYFIAKLVLFWRELSGFHPLENLAFAAFLLVPARSPRLRQAKAMLSFPIGLALLYYDSWLPPAARLFSQSHLLSNFDAGYLLELAGRFISWQMVAMLVLGWAVYRAAAIYLRVGVATLGVLLVLALASARQQPATALVRAPAAGVAVGAAVKEKSLDLVLQEFTAKEAQRSVRFSKAAGGAPPFDLIFLHICSLSWDDLQATGLDQHNLWKRLDFVFHHFNSAAPYSGPAAIRLHRAPCGQQPYKGLYARAPEQCYLMPSLKQAGFEPNLVFNHDGHFDDFLSIVREQGVSAELMPLNAVAVPQRSFDNSPIYDDSAVLARWLERRQKTEAQRVAMYYNTISLHDGNRLTAGANAGKSSAGTYKARLAKLLDDIDGFMSRLERSGRRAVVVVVPEHGAALRGDRMQIAGLREIATPAITTVPVGIKVIGPDARQLGGAAHIADATSYLAVSHIIGRMLEISPFGADGFSADSYLTDLPKTDFVAETEDGVMLQREGKFFLRQGKEDWKQYEASYP